MSFTFRPAVREATPLIIGLAGPTKSGKTLSAHRLAAGLANGGVVAMLNAEGARGHQYAEKFTYVACDIEAPFSPARYTEALLAAKALNPAVLIIDSVSHLHDGPGGLLEMHDSELDRMAGEDWKKRERMTWAAWIRPKKDENEFIYTMLGMRCPIVLCMRAKEKIKIVPGKPPVDLGWQPITSDRIAFETIFTLVLPPHCKGVPDLSISEMREPFDSMIPEGKQLDEGLGRRLAEWSRGGAAPAPTETWTRYPADGGAPVSAELPPGSGPTDAMLATGGQRRPSAAVFENAAPKPPTFASISDLINRARKSKDTSLLVDAAAQWVQLPDEGMRASLDVEARKAWRDIKGAA